MIRLALLIMVWANLATADVQIDPTRTSISDGWRTLHVAIGLNRITPYRAFTLDDPRRLVIDLADVSADRVPVDGLLSGDRASGLRILPLRPGWARVIIDLTEPLMIDQAGIRRHSDGADLTLRLRRTDPDEFAARSGAPPDPGWEQITGFDPALARDLAASDDFILVLDPGHGGVDAGAVRAGVQEADLMLLLAREMQADLAALCGVTVVLTRDADIFVPLSARLTFARDVGADLFISLHADALAQDQARGAAVYTLSDGGGPAASARHVERHGRADLLAGVDLGDTEDRVATALMDLARARTGPEGRRIADALVASMQRAGVTMNSNPRRQGQYAVLTAAGFPSVLIEAGFLSNPQDRAVLATPEGRARIIRAVADTVALLAR